ncbi:glycoside hydrolase family 130 protein [Teredinibacter franksiae]|uniref:glycoside hydrolase family 130 protein n=1 Tax=Teredinibacter franksiae TaxID=2761453 RepID=UPI0016247DFE|nr:glycoside hydrolase family 130 protein [Teredinibacter franksiae]
MNGTLNIRRRKWKLNPDPSKVICRPLIPHGNPSRIKRIIDRVLHLPDQKVEDILNQITTDFADRHRYFDEILHQHFVQVESYLPENSSLSKNRRALIGAYFTMEYSVASAALFNPSIIKHPDQSGLEPSSLRFIMSLRAVGEGHISSIVFRSGVIGASGNVLFDPEGDYLHTPILQLDAGIDKHLFELKLSEMGSANEITNHILMRLPDPFRFSDLQVQIDDLSHHPQFDEGKQHTTISSISWLANSNYELIFPQGHPISERVIFPTSEDNSRGIEDARFVQFYEDNGDIIYYATYTAYNGSRILPQLIETRNFEQFKIITLNGNAVQDKGMALFPRKINGMYVMLSRQGGENSQIMYSDHLHFWQESSVIQEPSEPWELVQIGNCGSPLETSEGWLVLTHGVGPMREYSIGAILLDIDDPSRIIARLTIPLLSPHEHEREGYVPNVVYSCGALIHNNDLIIPYAMSDISSGMASVNVSELIASMARVGEN